MTDLLLYLVVAATAAVLIRGLLRRGGYLEFPFLAAAVYAGWFLPQAIALQTDPRLDLARVLAMSLLCLGAIVFGWKLGATRRPRHPPIDVRVERMIWPVLALTAFATAMQLLIELQPAEARAMRQWTGTLTILFFFSQVGIVSLSFSLLLFLRRRSPATIALLGWNLALYAPAVLIFFRRAEVGELIVATLLALYFVPRITIPRTLVLAGLVAGFVFVHAVGHLRALGGGYQLDDSGQITTRIPTFEEIAAIDFFAATPLGETGHAREVRNAVEYMSAIERSGDLTLGAEFWNRIVFGYVPAQFFGVEFKQSLMIGTSLSDLALREEGYEAIAGTTSTGFTKAYRDFWYFGALVFFATGCVMGRLYLLAKRGDLFSQVFYMSTIILALLAITHSSYYFFVNMPILLASTLAALWAARSLHRLRYRPSMPLDGRFEHQRMRKMAS